MLFEYERFWECVQTETPPPPTKMNESEIRIGKGGKALNNLLGDYYKAHETRKELKTEKDDLKGRILSRCRHLDKVETEEYWATINQRSRGDTEYYVLKVRKRS
jgi:hypothetical protein